MGAEFGRDVGESRFRAAASGSKNRGWVRGGYTFGESLGSKLQADGYIRLTSRVLSGRQRFEERWDPSSGEISGRVWGVRGEAEAIILVDLAALGLLTLLVCMPF